MKTAQIFLILSFLFLLTSCASVAPPAQNKTTPSDSKPTLVDQYYIGVDDVVAVNVWKNPDLSIRVPVRPDGRISVPLIGEVIAGGRTPVDVATDITNRLSVFIKDPQVAVILEQLNSHEYLARIRVTGAVRNPLSINYRQGMTVLDLVLEAGGLNEFASANSTKLFRRVDGKIKTIYVNLDDILNNGDMSTNFAMLPGDIISIPERVF